MADRRVLVQVKKIISTVWIMGKFDIGQLGCWTALVQHFGNSKFSDKYDVGPATRPIKMIV